MIDWWGQYEPFIKRRTFMESGGPLPDPLSHCRHLAMIGKCNRVVNFRDTACHNSVFDAYARDRKMALEETHAMFQPNLAAMYQSIAKYDTTPPQYEKLAWEIAQSWTIRHFMPYMNGAKKTSLADVYKNMDKKTSCGYPWSLEFQNKGELLDKSWASTIHYQYWAKLLTGSYTPIWTVAEKREIRTIEKIKANRVRTFTAAPFELLSASNVLLLDMNNRFYRGAGRTWSMVGASKYMRGWDDLYRRLNKHPNAFELDEKDFDSVCSASALEGVRDLRKAFVRYSDEDISRLDGIYAQIINSCMVLEDGNLIQKFSGNPSGSPNTVVDNTLVLYKLFAYAWITLAQRFDKRLTNFEAFHSNVEAALYGDDNTYTCSDLVVGWFTPRHIIPIWLSIGITATARSLDPLKLKNVEFLSQGFRYDEHLATWLPVPSKDKIIASIRYGTKYDDPRWHYLRGCALRMDSWGSLECRELIVDYLHYICEHYSDKLVGEINGITMLEIQNSWKDDREMSVLYAGYESAAYRLESKDNAFPPVFSSLQKLVDDELNWFL